MFELMRLPARSCSSWEVGRASPAVVSIQPLELGPSKVCGQRGEQLLSAARLGQANRARCPRHHHT